MGMIRASELDHLAGVRHAFFTRDAGVSEGLFASLNCAYGSGDMPSRVRENRARAMGRLDLEGDVLVTARQTHSARVSLVEGPLSNGEEPEADGLVTVRRGLALGILTADCAPVLFADRDAGVVGAAHAGWRGALAGILEATLEAMLVAGARRERTVAAIGPSIRRESYEVGPEFLETFLADDAANDTHFEPARRGDRLLFDLSGYIAGRLERLALRRVGVVAGDTCAEADRFFSYRRAHKAGEERFGSGLSAIALVDTG